MPAPTRSLVWTAAPVRDKEGRIVAVLCLGRYASARFSGMLAITRPGGTGEAYAFDAAGRMVSGSRFEDRLRAMNLLAANQPSLGHVMLHVPDAAQGIRSGVSRPTQLLAESLRDGASAGDRQGILLEPYPNYLGEPVIGAWQWLGEHQLGLAVEISEAEAYKSIRILNTLLLIMVMTLAVALFIGPTLPAILWRRVMAVRHGQVVGDYRLDKKDRRRRHGGHFPRHACAPGAAGGRQARQGRPQRGSAAAVRARGPPAGLPAPSGYCRRV